jgi:hypothetical protein
MAARKPGVSHDDSMNSHALVLLAALSVVLHPCRPSPPPDDEVPVTAPAPSPAPDDIAGD